MRWLVLILPFGVPFLFHWLYQPLNESWTVKRFGCGCPPMTAVPGSWNFNANHFNLLIWIVLFVACALTWWLASARDFRKLKPTQRLLVRGVGLYVLLLACARHYAKEGWL